MTTKTRDRLLVLIAVLLFIIAWVQIDSRNVGRYQYLMVGTQGVFCDTRTGKVWSYAIGSQAWESHKRLVKPFSKWLFAQPDTKAGPTQPTKASPRQPGTK